MIFLRAAFLISLLNFNNNHLFDFKFFQWRSFALILFIWLVAELVNKRKTTKKEILMLLGISGFYRFFLLYLNPNFHNGSFYSPPDSKVYESLAKSLFTCFEYARVCGEMPYFKRPPFYSTVLSVFTLGGNIGATLLIILQILLTISIFYMLWLQLEEIISSWVNIFPIIFVCIAPVAWTFSRLVLSDVWGVWFVTLAWFLSSRKQIEQYRESPIWIALLLFSLLLQIQYFAGVFLFYIKTYFFSSKGNKRRKFIINILLITLTIFLWGSRSTNYYGTWDFNPYTGCYLEKNIMEASEAKIQNKSIYEIRNSGATYALLNDESIANQSREPHVCKLFMKILPEYIEKNLSVVLSHFSEFIFGIIYDINSCQYEEVNCESGYWLWLNLISSNYIALLGAIFILLKKDLFYFSDMLIYISLLACVTILVGVDIPRMRILFEPYFYFLFGYSIQSLFIKSSKIKKLSKFLDS